MNRRKIFAVVLISFLWTAMLLCEESAKQTAAEGGNLSGYSTSDLITAMNDCGAGDETAYNNLEMEVANRDTTIQETVSDAQRAESDVCDALKDYQEEYQKVDAIKKNYDKKIKEMTSLSDKIEAWKEKNAEVKAQKTVVKEKYAELCDKADAMSDAYKKVAEVYEKYGISGDPVQLRTGSFIAEYEDFAAEDFLDSFVVKRAWKTERAAESFGKNWSCSLDSRIVRCVNENTDEFIAIIDDAQSSIDNCKSILDAYAEKWPDYIFENVEEAYEEIGTDQEFFNDKIKMLNDFKAERTRLLELNRYTAYGNYSSEDSFWGHSGLLKFIDENGDEQVFEYAENGLWKNISYISSSDFYIYSIDTNGNVEATEYGSGGYLLCYKNGAKKYFSRYGVLEKYVDKNGNLTRFYSENGKITKINLKTGEEIGVTRDSYGQIVKISGTVSGTAEFKYSGNFLIQVNGNDNQKLYFGYDSDGYLTSIRKADGKSVSISYEESEWGKDWSTEVGKKSCMAGKGTAADESTAGSVSSGNSVRKVCTSVTDEDGNTEYFSYDCELEQVRHIPVCGEEEIVRFNGNGFPVYVKDLMGNVTEFTIDERGLITGKTENGFSKFFSYDSDCELISVTDENDGRESFVYDEKGFIKRHCDSDGFYEAYDYDSCGNAVRVYFCGNIVSSVDYYSNGLIKRISENEHTIDYEYNAYGSVTLRKQQNYTYDWENITESWNYDSNNRLIKYQTDDGVTISYRYSKNGYGTFDIEENYGAHKNIIRKFDERNREIETLEKDLLNGIEYSKAVTFNGKGKPEKIYLDGKLFSEYGYEPDGKLAWFVIWNNCGSTEYVLGRQGIKTEYTYNNQRLLVQEKKSCVYEDEKNDSWKSYAMEKGSRIVNSFKYEKENDESKIEIFEGNSEQEGFYPRQIFYDAQGKIVKEIYPDGYYKEYSYSKAGRILEVLDSSGKCWNYEYQTDGTIAAVITDSSGNTAELNYNKNGLISSFTDFDNLNYEYIFDSDGNKVKEIRPEGFFNWSYDKAGRNKACTIKDRSGQITYQASLEYDDNNLIQKIYLDGELFETSWFDAWNRIYKTEGTNGTTAYSFDVLGNCESQTNSLGKSIYFEYSAAGDCALVKYPDGQQKKRRYLVTGECTLEEKAGLTTRSISYNSIGLISGITDNCGNETKLSYSKNGLLKNINSSDTGNRTISCNQSAGSENSSIRVSDSYGNEFIYWCGISGSVVKEKNQLGLEAEYNYSAGGRRNRKTNFSGRKDYFYYSDGATVLKTVYGNGEESLTEHNSLGFYKRLEKDESLLDYEYNHKGLLKKLSEENSGIEISYEYDKYRNCVAKKSEFFDFVYEYDSLGRLVRAGEEKSGVWLAFTYDENSYEEDGSYRVSEIVFSNGNTTFLGYDEYGRKTYAVTRKADKTVLWGEFLLYDEKGKIKTIYSTDNGYECYEYDSNGRLIESVCKWSQNLEQYFVNEAVSCGIYLKNTEFNGEQTRLSDNDVGALRKIIKMSGFENEVQIESFQTSWVESYSYNSNGSMLVTENPVSTFLYEYDSMNRLILKHGRNSESQGKKFKWDDDGNLLEIESQVEKVVFIYGAQNRPVRIDQVNYKTGSEMYTEYTYDAIGRRVTESVNGSDKRIFVYDGLSDVILFSTPVMNGGRSGAEMYYDFNESEIQETKLLELISEENYDLRIDSGGYSETGNFRMLEGDFSVYGEESSEKEDLYAEQLSASDFYDSRPCAFLNVGELPFGVIYMESGSSSGYDWEEVIQNSRNQTVKTLDEAGQQISKIDYDIWGNIYSAGKNVSYAGISLSLRGCTEMLDLGRRDYVPQMNCFSSMDAQRDGGNWFGYSVCDPVNYYDKSGFFKEELTEKEKADYAAAIAEFAKYDIYEMQNNQSWNGLPVDFNCTEVSSYIDYIANSQIGVSTSSEMEKNFAKYMSDEDIKAAADTVCSAYIYKDGSGKNAMKTSSELSDLKNPEIVTPGTVLVWAPDESTKTGHTLTVLARKFDENNNVIGFAYIEGHLSKAKLTELGYCSIDGSYPENDIKLWRGEYQGTYELSGSNSGSNCVK